MRKLARASEIGGSRFLGDLSLLGAEHFARAEESLRCTQVSQKTKKTDANTRTSELESHQAGKGYSQYPSFMHRKKSWGWGWGMERHGHFEIMSETLQAM